MQRKAKRLLSFAVLICLLLLGSQPSPHVRGANQDIPVFQPTPNQDTYNGRNSHAYLPSTNLLTNEKQEQFIKRIGNYALDASKEWGVPASAIIGMAALESGYGTTRIAHFANNLFGIKIWGGNESNAWQLVGQPNEDFERAVPVLADYGADRKVFDESQRRDNWYRLFQSEEEAVRYLAGTLLLNDRYGFARDHYQQRVLQGWTDAQAAKQFLYDIAEAGYNHLGGEYYRNAVGKIMDQWRLYDYDDLVRKGYVYKDIYRHWAQDTIEALTERKIISGFPDQTFRPQEPITRAQYIKLLIEAVNAQLGAGNSFKDVPKSHWAHPYIEAAIKQNIILPNEYGQSFEPNKALTRQEMAILAARALDLEPVSATLTFADQTSIDHHSGLIGATVQQKIIVGFEDHTFRPHEVSTRAQSAVIISRILDYLARK